MNIGPMSRRMLAALIDVPVSVIAIVAGGMLAGALERGLSGLHALESIRGALGLALVWGTHAAYYILTTALAGATAGKYLLELRVVDRSGGRPTIRTAAIRYVGQLASNLLLGLGHLICLVRSDRRSLQDLLAGTQVLGRQEAVEPVPGAAGPAGGFHFTPVSRAVAVLAVGVAVWMGYDLVGKFQLLQQSSGEGATKGNLNAIRSAISIYYGDTEGLYPASLSTAPDSPFSRYLEKIPMVTANHGGFGKGKKESPRGNMITYTVNETITITGQGWRYNPETGHIFVNSCATDSRGLPYSCYGY